MHRRAGRDAHQQTLFPASGLLDEQAGNDMFRDITAEGHDVKHPSVQIVL